MRASSGASVSRGKSARSIPAMSRPLRSTSPTARWISRISPAVSRRIQLAERFTSDPYQTSGPLNSGTGFRFDGVAASVTVSNLVPKYDG